ncbi:MAG: 50S ribosomal protein L18 [Proteobacteria bacterium]|nr:50S ribosomal protein L18 [Pseudomonadota bacterium]
MSAREEKNRKHLRRKKRIRKHIAGTAERPRLTVYRSLHHIYAQLIDDAQGSTVLGVSTRSKELQGKLKTADTIAAAQQVGTLVAEKALALKVERVVFDRNGYLYHGRIKALADAARAKGLKF